MKSKDLLRLPRNQNPDLINRSILVNDHAHSPHRAGRAGHGVGHRACSFRLQPSTRSACTSPLASQAIPTNRHEPSRIEVRKGEQIRFVLRNVGTESHEFVLATPDENRKHEEVMKKFPNMEHDDPNAKRVAVSGTAELLWVFTKLASLNLPVSFRITVRTE